jgi:glutamate-1-semialdehyde 2,1-aminomutase
VTPGQTRVPRLRAEAVAARYAARRPHSEELYARLRRTLPGGETRSVTYYEPFPTAIARGDGPTLVDVDGISYIDVLNNYTALVHGHAFPPIVDAIREAAAAGTAFPAPTPALADFAEVLVERFPAVERVRFTNSGTEAAILALRIARAVTGRRTVICFDGGYHGTAPPFAGADPDARRVPYNDLDAVRDALDETIAAVFAEPFLGSGGVVPAEAGFLDGVAAAAHAAGALFVLDEVQAARNAYAGAHASLAEAPDLVLLGKLIGGGLPVGAVGGAEQLLEVTAADRGTLPHSGTFNANAATVAAGLVSIDALDAEAIESLNSHAGRLAGAIESAGRRAGVPCCVTRAGSILHVHLLDRAPRDAAAAALADPQQAAMLHLLLLEHGVYAAPRGMLNLSTAMSADDLSTVAAAYDQALAALASGGPDE